MAGNEYADWMSERKALDFAAAANKAVSDVAGSDPDARIVCLSALIGSLTGNYGPARMANDWEALTNIANRASAVHYKVPDTTRPQILRLLNHQLRTEQAASSPYRSDPFAGLHSVDQIAADIGSLR